MNSKNLCFTKEWTLFLDRDGVISQKLPGDYVRKWEEFRFTEGALEALALFGLIFGRIVIVSNQQGVGKGLMSRETLEMIDARMKSHIAGHGGRIDASYYSPYLASENHPDRKPGIGMALKAQTDFREIDFSRSVMVGDSLTDMEFGKKLGMTTVMITEEPDESQGIKLIDHCFHSLKDFSLSITSKTENRKSKIDL